MENACSTVFLVGKAESLAMSVKFVVPLPVGVPLMMPVVAFSESPAGSVDGDLSA